MGSRKLAAAALLGFAAWVFFDQAQAGNDLKMSVKGTWLHRFLGVDKKEAPPKKEEPTKAAEPAPSVQEIQAKAKTDLLRRQEICLRLREIAVQTGDEELNRKADQLDQRAFEIYLQRTGGSTGRDPSSSGSDSLDSWPDNAFRDRTTRSPATATTPPHSGKQP